MADGPRVVVVDPNGGRRDVPISAFPFRIGRQAGNELTFRDSRVSRQQARIIEVNGTLVLEDMGSSHGTFVNGEKILSHELKPNDQIDFGVSDSYRVIYLAREQRSRLVGVSRGPAPSEAGPRELHHLGVFWTSRGPELWPPLEDILTVVDAAIAGMRTERGVLCFQTLGELETARGANPHRVASTPPKN